MTSAKSKPWRGIYPIAPTPFTATGDVDQDGHRRVLDCMIDQGVDGICILANYSEQFLLTDDERNTLTAPMVAEIVEAYKLNTDVLAELGTIVTAARG